MARLVWRFVEAEILSGGGALWSAATDLPPSPRSQLGGVVVRLFPVPEFVERRLRLLKLLKVRVMRSRSTATTALQGGGSFELRPVDFPSAMGLLPIQGCGGGAAAARRRHVFFDDDVIDVLQDWILNGAIILETLQCTFGNLKSLTLYTQFCELPSILSTYCLLRNAPNLERLKILIDDGAEQKFEAHGEFQNSQWTGGMFAKLQFLQMTGIHWLPNEMTFIELILSKARLFRMLSVTHGEKCSMSNEDAMNKILNYRRASTCAEVLFKGKASVRFFAPPKPAYV